MVTGVKRIWLCADDYGIAPGVNSAIRDLLVRKRLNATSVMVVAPSFSPTEVGALMAVNGASSRFAIGLHLTLTGPLRPLSRGYTPVADGRFLSLSSNFGLAIQERLEMSSLRREIEAQFAAFAQAFARPPDFVDGHRHIHLFPQVCQTVLEVMGRLAPRAWVRQCSSASPLLRRISDPKGLMIDWLSRAFRARALHHNIETNTAFAGTYAYRGSAKYSRLFPKFLDGMPEGGLIMCHPGFVDEQLRQLDKLTTLREQEYAYFSSDRFRMDLEHHGIAINK
jgi:predicted glycoside hydrolase/deacetylase ChbG (UPF0249 family)